MSGEGKKIFGKNSESGLWIPIAVDSSGRVQTYNLAAMRPLFSFYEGWQDEAGIDATQWIITDPATGAAWNRGAVGSMLMASSTPNANETARIRSTFRISVVPNGWGIATIARRFSLEFEMMLQGIANMDNALSFFGLTTGIADGRNTNNIIGFGLNADALQTVTDDGGAETTATGFGETLINLNKYRIDVSQGHVVFSLNETQLADHVTNLPDYPFYLNFFLDTEAGGNANISLGIIRMWLEDINR